MKKEGKGITLIALVITIVVLLILAGVTITTLTGDNGLLQKANEAKTETEKSAIREEIDLLLLQAKMGDKIEDIFKEGTVTKDGAVYEVSYKGNDFLVSDENEYIEKVEPAYEGEWTFNTSTQTLTKYNGDLTTKRGNQEIGEVIIPNYYNGKRVKAIGNSLFKGNTNLTKLTISEGIVTIGSEVFSSCKSLKGNIIIPNSINSIGSWTFYNCIGLDGNIKLGDNLQTISGYVFMKCINLRGDLIIPDSIITLGDKAFCECSSLDGTLKLGNNIENLGMGVFAECENLKGDIIIPRNVTEIPYTTFARCKSLNSVKLNENLKKIGYAAFTSCVNMSEDIIIPENVILVEGYAFGYSNKINSLKFLNKNTEICDADNTMTQNIKIIGYAGSTAEKYAAKYNRTFEPISE